MDPVKRPVFLIHYVSTKPWQNVEQYQAGKEKQLWPDVQMFYEYVEQLI